MDLGRLNESICVVCRAVSLGLVCCISKFFSPFFFPLPCVCQCNAVRACGYWFIWADILNWSYVFSPPLQIELHVYHTRARHVQVNISGYLIGHVLADVFLFRILFCTLRTVLFFPPVLMSISVRRQAHWSGRRDRSCPLLLYSPAATGWIIYRYCSAILFS